MSALAWVALAGWAAFTTTGWIKCHRQFWKLAKIVDETDKNFWAMADKCDWWIKRHRVAEQQALDDRAACDAMREELQMMKTRKRRAR